MTLRRFLYWSAARIGDYNAVKRGRYAQRVGNHFLGRLFGRMWFR
jgi:hypothetical protein